MLPQIEIPTEWTPVDALRLLDDHEGCLPAALVRLGTLHGIDMERLAGVIDLHREAGLWSRRRLTLVERSARHLLAVEAARRVRLLCEVAEAHGMAGGAA